TNNGLGVAGACPKCRVRCVRLLNDTGMVSLSADVEAFQFALQTGAAVVSNSWGFSQAIPVPKALADAINHVHDTARGGRGALILFASGNDDRLLRDDELLGVRGVIGVGATNSFDEGTPFTNYGPPVDLVAPTGTLTTDVSGPDGDDKGDYTSNFGGTSSACPVAAGVAGLLVSAAPERSVGELEQLLVRTARRAPYAQPDSKGHDFIYGYGIVDPVRALKAIYEPEVPDAGAEPDAALPPPDPGSAGDAPGCGCGTACGGRGAFVLLLLLAAGARFRRSARQP
ncbi:MAG: S8 family serine peptidase, partial [Myxococcales bacterium]